MLEYTAADLTVEQANEMRTTYEPLAQSVRDLIDAAIRSQTDAATVAIAKAEIDSATRRLRSRQLKGAFGARRIIDGEPTVVGQCRHRHPQSGRTTLGDQPGSLRSGMGRRDTSAPPTKDRPVTCTAE